MINIIKNRPISLFKIALFILVVAGCNNQPAKTTEQPLNKQNYVAKFFKSIPIIRLPFKDSCTDTMALSPVKIPDSLTAFKKYGELIGKVTENKNYTALLYVIPADVELPVLRVFDTNGNTISSLKLLIGNCCGENEECSGLSTVQITKDVHIILKDSMQTFERSKRNLKKKKNIQTIKKQVEYAIDSTGKILPVVP